MLHARSSVYNDRLRRMPSNFHAKIMKVRLSAGLYCANFIATRQNKIIMLKSWVIPIKILKFQNLWSSSRYSCSSYPGFYHLFLQFLLSMNQTCGDYL